MKPKRISISANIALVLALVLVITVIVSPQTSGRFEMDGDEGVNLSKAMLVAQGYKLYSEIWSDQPPLFTFLLAGVVQIFGYSVLAARVLIVLFAGLLVGTSFRILELGANTGTAIVGTLLLILTDPFIRVSNVVLVGLPAIALASFAVYSTLKWHRSGRTSWLVASALAMAFSIGTKLFTAAIAPVLFVGIWLAEARSTKRITSPSSYRASLIWMLVFLAACVLLLAIVGWEGIQQLVQPHVEAREISGFVSSGFYVPPAFLLLVSAGVVLIVMDKKWNLAYPLAWMFISFVLLSTHSPVWYHQKLLFTSPATMVAAYPIYEGYKLLRNTLRRALKKEHGIRVFVALTSLPLLAAYLVAAIPAQRFEGVQPSADAAQIETPETTLARIALFAPETEWILTDMPMYAFRAGIPIPPYVAVITEKRIRTNNLSEEDLLQAIDEYKPEQILLGRFEYSSLYPYLESYLLLTCEGSATPVERPAQQAAWYQIRHYVRREILATSDINENCE